MTDVNDNTPIFREDFINLTLSESLPVETPILNLVATDNDFGLNGLVNFTILNEQAGVSDLITSGMSHYKIQNAIDITVMIYHIRLHYRSGRQHRDSNTC